MAENALPEISIILPCRNEEKALPFCLEQIKEAIAKNNFHAEIIVSDSSTDSSPEIAKREGAVLVKHDKKGYGNAYLEAFPSAKGKYIFMADADCTYDFNEMPDFIKQLEGGFDFVIGDRFKGRMSKGAMRVSHRLGNFVLSGILKLFFGNKVNDAHCGMRAFRKDILSRLKLQTAGMEFASEMVIKAIKTGVKIKELPINYHPRKGESKLKAFRDSWKHIRFMLLYSPLFLFFIPGIVLFSAGLFFSFLFYFTTPRFFGIRLYSHPLFLSSLLLIIGYQLVTFSFFSKAYAINHLGEKNHFFEKLFEYITIETAGILGAFIAAAGIIIFAAVLQKWISSSFGSIDEIKNFVVAMTLVILGVQTVFSAFMLSILSIKEK